MGLFPSSVPRAKSPLVNKKRLVVSEKGSDLVCLTASTLPLCNKFSPSLPPFGISVSGIWPPVSTWPSISVSLTRPCRAMNLDKLSLVTVALCVV